MAAFSKQHTAETEYTQSRLNLRLSDSAYIPFLCMTPSWILLGEFKDNSLILLKVDLENQPLRGCSFLLYGGSDLLEFAEVITDHM